MSAGENQRKRGEVVRRLTAIKSIADEFAAQENHAAALTIYGVLIPEVIEHFNDYRDEYVAFSVILMGCIDGLDSCFAGEEDNPGMRLRVLRMLFAIYRSCSTGTPTEGTRGCEHATALLLAWNKQPEMFTQTDDIDTILERHSKAQLITLVKQLLQKQPKVEWQLTMPPLASHKSVPIDTQEYRRQVDAAFRHAGREWDAVYGISHDLYQITATAARFARQRDYANATVIYEVVAMGTLSHYLSYHDEDGALGRVVQDCVEGLGACLESEREDAILRERILEAIFAVYRFDVNHGGFGLTGDIPSNSHKSTSLNRNQFALLRSFHQEKIYT